MSSDGRFRIVVFGSDISQPSQLALVNSLGDWLSTTLVPRLPVITTPPFSTSTSIADVILVHSASRHAIELLTALHNMYHPFDEQLGWDYEKTFASKSGYAGDEDRAYVGYGVDADGPGAVVMVRPDGYVGLVTSLDESGRGQIGDWFRGLMRCF